MTKRMIGNRQSIGGKFVTGPGQHVRFWAVVLQWGRLQTIGLATHSELGLHLGYLDKVPGVLAIPQGLWRWVQKCSHHEIKSLAQFALSDPGYGQYATFEVLDHPFALQD